MPTRTQLYHQYIQARVPRIIYDAQHSTSYEQEITELIGLLASHLTNQQLQAALTDWQEEERQQKQEQQAEEARQYGADLGRIFGFQHPQPEE